MRRRTCGTSSELPMAQYQVPTLFADPNLFQVHLSKVFHFRRLYDSYDHNIYAARGGSSVIGVEHSAGSGTVFITRHTWFNRLKAIPSSGGWVQVQPAPLLDLLCCDFVAGNDWTLAHEREREGSRPKKRGGGKVSACEYLPPKHGSELRITVQRGQVLATGNWSGNAGGRILCQTRRIRLADNAKDEV